MNDYRVCKNCPRKFPVTQETREFCSPNCRKQWHRNGGPNWGRLKELIAKVVREEIAKALTERAV